MSVGCLSLVVYMCLLVVLSLYVSARLSLFGSLYVSVGCLCLVVYMCLLVVLVW